MKSYLFVFFLFIFTKSFSQENLTSVLTLAEFLSYVKNYHPILKQANLVINDSEAKLLKSRGAFDPKIAIDFNEKEFKGTEYYSKLNTTFKIPTWYGIELKANFENNDGEFLSSEAKVPDDGLYSAGISASLLRNFLINERMASIKKAKIFLDKAKEDQQILVNEILFNASLSYFEWLQNYQKKRIYEDFFENAQIRFNGIKTSFIRGEKAAIDTLEAGIAINERKLQLEKARIKFVKSSLELSNFLWLNNNIPIELNETIVPDINTLENVDTDLNIALFNDATFDINNHPKIKSLTYKIESLDVDKSVKLNNLLPKFDVQYNFLTETPRFANSFTAENYKAGINFQVPLFLRKERGDLKLAKIKIQETTFENELTKVTIKNELSAVQQEMSSFVTQTSFINGIVKDYSKLLNAEERKFFMGESSFFLVNTRESKLIESKLKAIDIENLLLANKAKLFKVALINITDSE